MTSDQSNSRTYKALDVACPQCKALPDAPCVDEWSYAELRGVHRARDMAYNQLERVARGELKIR